MAEVMEVEGVLEVVTRASDSRTASVRQIRDHQRDGFLGSCGLPQNDRIINPPGLANLVAVLREVISNPGNVGGKRKACAPAEAQHIVTEERKQLTQTGLGIGGVHRSDPQFERPVVTHGLMHLRADVFPPHGHCIRRTALVGERDVADRDPRERAANVGESRA